MTKRYTKGVLKIFNIRNEYETPGNLKERASKAGATLLALSSTIYIKIGDDWHQTELTLDDFEC